MRPNFQALAVALSLTLASAASEARSVRDEPYPFATAWNAAIRLIRVDYGCVIVERDQDVGFFTFNYRDGARTVPGSVEIVRTTLDGRDAARVIVQIPQMPTYVESLMLNQLGRKLRTEFGEPTPPPRRAPTPPVAPGTPPTTPPEAPSNNVPATPISPGVNLPIIDPNAPSPPVVNPPQNPPR